MKLLQSFLGFLIQWYDNGIYYPNVFLLVVTIIGLSLIVVAALILINFFPPITHGVISFLVDKQRIVSKKWNSFIRFYRRKNNVGVSVVVLLFLLLQKKMSNRLTSGIKFLQKDPLMVFIILLMFTLLTRFSVSYFDPTRNVVAPEKIFQLGIAGSIGRDLYVGVYEPALALIGGKGFYTPLAATGPALLSIAGPFIHAAFKGGFCSFTTLGCLYYFYKTFLIVSFVSYVLFVLFVIHRRPREIKLVLLVYFLIFFLGVPGSIGLERGNIDVLLSMLVGFMLLLFVHISKKNISLPHYLLLSIIIGIMGGFIANTKLFLIPFALVLILFSPSPLITFLMSSITFLASTAYLPRTLFGADATIEDLLLANTNGMNLGFTHALFFNPERLSLTHSAEAIASLFTDCVRNVSCLSNSTAPLVISIISKLLLFAAIGIPIILSAVYMFRIIKRRLLRFPVRNPMASIVYYFYTLRNDKQTILFYFILADAVINLVPRISYTYRLYYSLPIVLLMYAETTERSRARFYCYLSMMCLAIKGFWIYYSVNPTGMTMFDARAMSLFVVLHFYFLMRAGLAGIEDRLNTVVFSF